MKAATRLARLGAGALLLGTYACRDAPTATPSPSPDAPAASAAQPDQSVARAIALALASPERRAQVLKDMRESPLPQHGLTLGEYLRSERGRPLAAAAATAAHTTAASFVAAVDGRGLRMYVPRPLDRARWTGEGSVVVYSWKGRDATDPASTLAGFDVHGVPVRFGAAVAVTNPLIAIEPVGARSVTDAGGAEVRAHDAITTISTREEEEANRLPRGGPRALVSCDDNPDQDSCGNSSGSTAGIQLPYGWSYVNCTGTITADVDHDGIDDPCEERLAQEFRPYLQVSALDYDFTRETYYAVRRHSSVSRTIVILYMLGYHHDVDHVGDSEFITLELKDVGVATWELQYATLSAHWGTPVDNTYTWSYTDLQYPGRLAARPLVWVAESKHANYKTQNQCDSGAVWFDTCDHNSYQQEVVLPAGSNVGSASYRTRDCVISRQRVDGYNGTECFWSGDKFRGWTTNVPGVTPYKDVLWFAGF